MSAKFNDASHLYGTVPQARSTPTANVAVFGSATWLTARLHS